MTIDPVVGVLLYPRLAVSAFERGNAQAHHGVAQHPRMKDAVHSFSSAFGVVTAKLKKLARRGGAATAPARGEIGGTPRAPPVSKAKVVQVAGRDGRRSAPGPASEAAHPRLLSPL